MSEEKSFPKTSINWYPGHMAKTKRLILEKLNLIDIVYEVIDARMPYSSKIENIDDIIKNKPRILIMTKADLCDKKETQKWIEFYKNKGYKVILCNLTTNSDVKKIISLTEEMMEEKIQSQINKGLNKRKIRVLVVGIPNVGKSTLINKLVGRSSTKVGNKPGVTKSLEWIRVNNKIELLDTPGILWPKLEQTTVAYNLASLSAIKEEILPIDSVVVYILNTLSKYYKDILFKRYGLSELDEDIVVSLDFIGKKFGCLSRGGIIDYDKVNNIIINDMKTGIIKNITFDRFKDE